MVTDLEKGWLAGLFDGEGCLGLYIGHFRSKGIEVRTPVIRPRFSISNTDMNTLLEAKRIISLFLEENGFVNPSVYIHSKVEGKTNRNRVTPCFDLVIHNGKHLRYIIPWLTPSLICKKERALILMKFLVRKRSTIYQPFEFELVQQIKNRNCFKGNRSYSYINGKPIQIYEKTSECKD